MDVNKLDEMNRLIERYLYINEINKSNDSLIEYQKKIRKKVFKSRMNILLLNKSKKEKK